MNFYSLVMSTPFHWREIGISSGIAFLSGSVPYGFLIGRSNGIDLRKVGSGNIGATNVWRVMGKGWGTLAFLFDFLKGFLPVLLTRLILGWHETRSLELTLVFAALAAVIGHNYTPWLGFKGGKGVATSAGVLAALLPAALGVVLAAWILIFAATRIVSVASIVAAALLPFATWQLYHHRVVFFGFSVAAAALTIVRHRANIGRLLRGEEKRIGAKSVPKTPVSDSSSGPAL